MELRTIPVCKKCGAENVLARHNRRVCRDCEKASSRERTYTLYLGITQQERQSIIDSQGGKCKACGSDDPKSKKGFVIDHCHTSGKIRGALCTQCNVALGMVNDSKERLQQLMRYLNETH